MILSCSKPFLLCGHFYPYKLVKSIFIQGVSNIHFHFVFEPCHEIMALFILRKLILQKGMSSHPVGLDVWFLVGPLVYFHTSCVRTAKVLARLHGCPGSPESWLVAYVKSTIISWAGSFYFSKKFLYANSVDSDQMPCSAVSELSLQCLPRSHLWGVRYKLVDGTVWMSHVMRKPGHVVCVQQRCRSGCTFAHSDQCLCCSLLRQYNLYLLNPKFQDSSWAGQFESYLVAIPLDRFSGDEA